MAYILVDDDDDELLLLLLMTTMMMMMTYCRPMINNKFEEKSCGDGPSLATMFSDDKNMQLLIENIQVC